MSTSLLAIAAVSLVTSGVMTGVMRTYAIRHGVLDRPNARSSHQTPTPRGGGAALILAAAIGMTLAVIMGSCTLHDSLTLGAGMLALGAIGWIDDKAHVPPAVRLAVHVSVAVWTVVMFGGLPHIQFGLGRITLGAFGYVLGVLAIVWSINLFNFMDGIDGLAGSEAMLVLGTAAVLFTARGDISLGAIAAATAAASAGFLAWNWPPAKIFLGDVGSGTLGYLIAGLAMAGEHHGSVPVIAIVIASGVFVADATCTLARRFARGESPTQAHRDHAYQRLSRAWNGHLPVTLSAAATTLALAALAVVGTLAPSLVPAVFVTAALLLALLLFLTERRAPM